MQLDPSKFSNDAVRQAARNNGACVAAAVQEFNDERESYERAGFSVESFVETRLADAGHYQVMPANVREELRV